MPKHKQWLSATKQTGKKKNEVRPNCQIATTKTCWLLVVDAARRRLPRPPTIFLQVTHKNPTRGCNLERIPTNFPAVGVDFEEAGEKWRAGDATKSLRFFLRAIDAYDAGLQKFPRSFDLSYNK